MGTLSVKMPDEEIERVEKVAKEEGETKSSFMRKLAEKNIKRASLKSLEEIIGLWSEEKAGKIKEKIRKRRKETTKELKESLEKKFQ